jgi:hypothetical protein
MVKITSLETFKFLPTGGGMINDLAKGFPIPWNGRKLVVENG